MKNIKSPLMRGNKKVYKLKSATIEGYEFTKIYYKMEDGIPVRSEIGDDSSLTIVNIRKKGMDTNDKRTFIFSEGYIGAEKSYNEDGTKRRSWARKDGFGVSYLIKYIENNESNIDNFHVMFMNDKDSSEIQSELFAQAIKDLTSENVEKTYMWCHSKAGLLALRAFEKLKDENQPESEQVLNKIKAVITSMPTKGLDAVNRNKMVEKLNTNKALKVLPFSGFVKTALLSWYDNWLYKSTPAQVDLKKPGNEQGLISIKHNSKLGKIFDKIWGNYAFEKRVGKTNNVKYDSGYLSRVTSDENLDKIKDVDYEVLPLNLEIKEAMISLIKHAQVMPLILYAKKQLSRQKGDGIVIQDEQGIDNKRIKFKRDLELKAGHDVPTIPESFITIKQELLKDENDLDR